MLASGSIFAEGSGAFSSPISTTAKAGFTLGRGSDQMAEHAMNERLLDRLGLFDAPASKSSRYNVELELENEDKDWSFEITVMVEF